MSCKVCDGDWDKYEWRTRKSTFWNMNPKRTRGSRVLSYDQIMWLTSIFFTVEGNIHLLCQGHLLQLARIGSTVLGKLRRVAVKNLAGEIDAAIAEEFSQHRPPPSTKTEIEHPWVLIQFRDWLKLATEPSADGEVYELCCFCPTRRDAHRHFCTYLENVYKGLRSQVNTISLSTFRRFLSDYAPNVRTKGLREDVCNTCYLYMNSRNSLSMALSHVEKADSREALKKKEDELEKLRIDYQVHMQEQIAQKEYYRRQRVMAKKDWEKRRSRLPCLKVPFASRPRCASPTTIHISLDAQTIRRLPLIGSGDQPERFYFLQKIKLFTLGVVDEGREEGICFIWDQITGGIGGMSANRICSVLHHFLDRAYAGEQKMLITVDNCGVNKSYYLLGFAHHLVQSGYFHEVEFHFLVEGHTRMSCDAMFGWSSCVLKRSRCCSVEEVAQILNKRGPKPVRYSAIPVPAHHLFGFKRDLEARYRQVHGIKDFYSFLITRREGERVLSTPRVLAKRLSTDADSVDITDKLVRRFIPGRIQAAPIPPAAVPEPLRDSLREQVDFFPGSKMPYTE